MLVLKLKERPLGDKNTYMSATYSKPIYVSDNKVFIFYDTLFRKEGSSDIGGGASRIQVFEKKDGV